MLGILGITDEGLTLRRLYYMVQGRRIHDWCQTAQIVAMIHNANSKKPKPAAHFMPPGLLPYRSEGISITRDNIDLFADYFCGKTNGNRTKNRT